VKIRLLLDCKKQLRLRLIETLREEEGTADDCQRRHAYSRAGAEPQRGFQMLDCQIELPGTRPESSAEVPAARETRVQPQSAIDQRDHCAEIFPEDPQRERGIGKYGRVVAMRLQGAPSEINTFAAVRLRIVAAAVPSSSAPISRE
jgi:hypothetical protein